MVPVTLYTTPICPYCVAAKRFLDKKGVPYTEVDVSGDDARRQWLVEVTGQRTVPQIFVGETSIGGYTDLRALDDRGGFEPLLSR
ncbi:glutaredoxin 3 [Myxococcota bacterium]|jgi:glutaredoxin 3|nr:glutaredoxin 3 [Myxococcota bacterium]